MDVRKRVALRVKMLRKQRGLSQEQLAGRIERSPDAISNLERGRSIPTYETLEAIARGLGVPLSELFVEAEPGNPARTAALLRLTDAARQLDDPMLKRAAAIIEVLASDSG